ncbi:UvrD-helicase domain-containing protein [Sphingobacterium sp. MYb382]|uniref:UvrD-helicase domain-containing protein n=1 Tax=Sphingobacterium sp. MYb382 TaxID=2745278 RepID=UPI0030AEBA0A
MPQEINITDEDIRYAESVLLPIGKKFDEERKTFIRNLSTIDLQAVPGSGKTTALLAKLVILEKKLPFYDGSGILVISHTNAAIDEIKDKIQRHCPKLFSYPNFVGTIQGFVDEFLAVPFYNLGFKKKLNWIDTERYQEELVKLFNIIAWDKNYEQPTKWFYQRHINRATAEANGDSTLVKEICKQLIENEVRGLYYDFITDEIKNSKNDVLLKNNQNKKFIGLKAIILETLKKGIISFDYAYHFGELYLYKKPLIKEILQKRFPFAFVDEMQDMDVHQYNLLEKIFHDGGSSISIIQRIGDKNQAIYSSIKATDVWIDRADVLRLSGSQRLSKPIADVVKRFALYSDANFDIVGLNECVIKPHILIFENDTISNLIPHFARIVKTNKENNSFTNPDKLVKVVCWNTDWKEDNISRQNIAKLRLEDYHKGYKKEKSKPKQDYDCLKSYLLFYDKNKKTLEPLRKNILSAFLKILRLENINTLDGRPYTKKKLIDFIRERDFLKYEELNLNLYNWSIGIIKGKIDDVWNGIKVYTSNFFAIFSELALSKSSTFINSDTTGIPIINTTELEVTNHYKENGIEIEITSIHAVKGQTHCATLYLESYYHSNYESERLTNQFLGNNFQDNRVHHKSSVKMAYVGFSRPTDLLCIAIHKERFNALLKTIDKNAWEIVTV